MCELELVVRILVNIGRKFRHISMDSKAKKLKLTSSVKSA